MRSWWLAGLIGFVAMACGSRSKLDDGPLAPPSNDGGIVDAGHEPDASKPDAGCALPFIACGGRCVDPRVDPQNCGGCFNYCPTCVNGSCNPCNCGGYTNCGTNGACLCVDLATDPNNCGACGVACPYGGACVGGTCSAACCYDSQNTSAPAIAACTHGLAWLAWQYVPSCTIDVIRIELHIDGGAVALLADGGGKPGAILAQATVPYSTTPTWLGGDFMVAVQLQAGVSYWIAENTSTCSIAANGSPYPYYGSSSLYGPWDGPYTDYAWTSRVYGACEG